MSYSISGNLSLGLNANSVADTTTSPSSVSAGQGATRIFDALNKLLIYGPATYPPVNGRIIDFYTLISSTPISYDLTAALTAEDITKTVDMTGKKVVAFALWAPKANVNNIVITCPANGYELFGAAADRVTLQPGDRYCFGIDGELASTFVNPKFAVAATHKLISIAGTVGAGADKLYGLGLFGT
jgi:hypothetical protein